MSIRDLHLSDAQSAAQILHQSWTNTFSRHLDNSIVAKFSQESCLNTWKGLLTDKRPHLKHLGIFSGDILLGTISIGISRTLGETWQEVWAMHVSTNEQGKGLGGKLLKEAFRIVRAENQVDIHLFCIEANTQAMNFYLKHGGKRRSETSVRGFREVEFCWYAK